MDQDEGFVSTLFPELPPKAERWEVTFSRPMKGFSPCAPGAPGIIAMYTASKAEAIATVEASEDQAEDVARKLCKGMPWVAGAAAVVRPAGASVREIPLAD